MQWHLLEEPESFPETSSECSRWSWHRFLTGAADDSGGFPPETAAGVRKIEDPTLPLETLPSPVMAEDMNDEFDETLKVVVSLENSSSTDLAALVVRMLLFGLVKSSVRLCGGGGAGWWKVTGMVAGGGGGGGVGGGGGARLGVGGRGARRKRAWPVRLRREMSLRNFETVTFVRSVVSRWEGWWLWERRRTRCSIPFMPSDAASCMALLWLWSSIFGNPISSTAILTVEFSLRLVENGVCKEKRKW